MYPIRHIVGYMKGDSMQTSSHLVEVGAIRRRFGVVVIFLFFVITMVVLIIFLSHAQGTRNFIIGTDFRSFYTAGQMVLNRAGADLYDLQAQYAWQRRAVPEMSEQSQLLPFFSPPFTTIPMVAVALLPLQAAYVVWGVLNLILLGIACALLLSTISELSRRAQVYGLVLILIFFPVSIVVLQGQLSFLLVAAFLGSWRSFKAGKDRVGGLWLAVLLIKPYFLVIPVLVLLWKRRAQALAGLAAASAGLLITSYVLVGWHGLVSYVRLLFAASSWGDMYGIHPRLMHTWRGFLLFWAQTDDASRIMILWLIGVALALVLVLYAWRGAWRSGTPGFDLQWAMIITGSLFISAHCYVHDLILFLVSGALMLRYWYSIKRRSRPDTLLIALPALGYLAGWAAIANLFGAQQTVTVLYEILTIVVISLITRGGLRWHEQ